MRLDQFAKDMVTGSYDLVILNALKSHPLYGYDIVRRVSHRTKHTIFWNRGTVYRVLHHLERRGLVTSHWVLAGRSRERRYYRLTAQGRSASAARAVAILQQDGECPARFIVPQFEFRTFFASVIVEMAEKSRGL